MSVNVDVRDTLISMGIDRAKATQAAKQFSGVDGAINWVFSDAGEKWTPTPEPEWDPDFDLPEWKPTEDAPPAPAAAAPAFQSNNPFRRAGSGQPPPPPPPPPPRRVIDNDEEEQLRHALELSKAGDRDRAERERSVRASAPPPSPGPGGTAASGTTSDELALSVARLPAPPTHQPKDDGREDADLTRAIQESLMTASFHSTASNAENIPPPQPRTPGAPTVFLAVEQPTFATHVLQALAAVPQLRDVFAYMQPERDDPQSLTALHCAFASQRSQENNYVLADDMVRFIHDDWEVHPGVTLPPINPIIYKWIPQLHHHLVDAAAVRNNLVQLDDALADFFDRPEQLISTRLHSRPQNHEQYVTFMRGTSSPTSVHGQLAQALWEGDSSSESIEELADVIFVIMQRDAGMPAPKWDLEEEVVLDRYLTANAKWAAQIRAQQGVMQVELQRLREQVERLTAYQGNSVPDALRALIKHLGTSDTPERAALKEKLERIESLMGDKAAKLNSDVAEREAAARGGLFDSDDPTRTQHKYALRAALWHDGFMTPGKHLYAYVREGDEWWRVQGSAERTSFAEMQADTTGQFTDGGPYLLIYSRTGPRPPMPEGEVPEGAAQREDAGGVMDVDGDEAVGLPALVPTVSPTALPTLPPAPTPAPASVTAAPTAAPAPAVPVATSPAPPPARALPLSPKRAVRGPRPISHKSHSGSMSGSMSSMSSNDGDWDRRAAASPSTANWTETLETVTASPVDGPADVFAALLAPKKQDKGKDGDGDQIM